MGTSDIVAIVLPPVIDVPSTSKVAVTTVHIPVSSAALYGLVTCNGVGVSSTEICPSIFGGARNRLGTIEDASLEDELNEL